MLRRCRVSVSQAGYNTILDILAAGARAVVVPFASERETEQQLRAERLAACGVLELLPETQLTPTGLAQAVERAIRRYPLTISIDTGGARRSARLIANIIRDPTSVTGSTNGNFVSRLAGGIIGA
jgi:predicted glycosyltransferase